MHIAATELFRAFLRRSPGEAFDFATQTEGLPTGLVDKAHEIFSGATMIEFYPIGDKKNPGWMIILDQKFSPWFYKKDNAYIYDGFEIGDYLPAPETGP